MKSLYELTEEFSDLVLLLESEEVSEEEVAFEMQRVSEDIDNKALGYAQILRNWAIEADGLSSEIDKAYQEAKGRRKRFCALKTAFAECDGFNRQKADCNFHWQMVVKKQSPLLPSSRILRRSRSAILSLLILKSTPVKSFPTGNRTARSSPA